MEIIFPRSHYFSIHSISTFFFFSHLPANLDFISFYYFFVVAVKVCAPFISIQIRRKEIDKIQPPCHFPHSEWKKVDAQEKPYLTTDSMVFQDESEWSKKMAVFKVHCWALESPTTFSATFYINYFNVAYEKNLFRRLLPKINFYGLCFSALTSFCVVLSGVTIMRLTYVL